jgi:hypothetical protein
MILYAYMNDDIFEVLHTAETEYILYLNNKAIYESNTISPILHHMFSMIINNNMCEYIDMSGEFTLYGFEMYIDNNYKHYIYNHIIAYDLRVEYEFPDSLNTSQLFIKNISK